MLHLRSRVLGTFKCMKHLANMKRVPNIRGAGVCRELGWLHTEGVGPCTHLVEQHQTPTIRLRASSLNALQVARERRQAGRQRLLIPNVGEHRRKVWQYRWRLSRHAEACVRERDS
jgi:hypothetical protein